MPGTGHGAARDLLEYTDPIAAVARVQEIYDDSIETIRSAFARFSTNPKDPTVVEAHYPYLGFEVTPADLQIDSRPAYGTAPGPGVGCGPSFGIRGVRRHRPARSASDARPHRIPPRKGLGARAPRAGHLLGSETAGGRFRTGTCMRGGVNLGPEPL